MSSSSTPAAASSSSVDTRLEDAQLLFAQFLQTRDISTLRQATALATQWHFDNKIEDADSEGSAKTQAEFVLRLANTAAVTAIQTSDADLLEDMTKLGKALATYPVQLLEGKGTIFNNIGAANHQLFSRKKDYTLLGSVDRCYKLALEHLSPSDSNTRPGITMNVCAILNERAEVDGNVKHLDTAINYLHEAIETTAPSHRMYRDVLQLLSTLLLNHFMTSKDLSRLDESIAINMQLLESLPSGHTVERIKLMRTLSAAYRERARQTNDSENMDQSIAYGRDVLELVESESPVYPVLLDDLASALRARYDISKGAHFLTEATATYEQVLRLRPEGHPEHIRALNNVAHSYLAKKEPSSLRKAIDTYKLALQRCPQNSPHRLLLTDNLGVSHRELFSVTDDSAELNTAVRLQEEVLAMSPPGHPRRDTTLTNLATTLVQRFMFDEDVSNLDAAIRFAHEALELRPVGHPHRGTTLLILSSALHEQSKRLGETSYLEPNSAALPLAQLVSPDAESGSNQWDPGAMGMLGAIYIEGYQRTGDDKGLSKAIGALKLALEAHVEEGPSRATTMSNLAHALLQKFTKQRHPRIVAEAIELYEQVLTLRPPGTPRRDITLHQLGAAYLLQYQETNSDSDIKTCANYLTEALSLRSLGHPRRYETSTSLSAIYLLPNTPIHNVDLAFSHLYEGLEDSCGNPRGRLEEGRILTLNAHRQLQHHLSDATIAERLLHAYQIVVTLFPLVAHFGLDLKLRLSELRQSQDIGVYAATCALQVSKPEVALELLEQARGVFWSQMLRLRSPQLDGLAPELASQLEELFAFLNNSAPNVELRPREGNFFNTDISKRREKSQELQKVIDNIRMMPGTEKFLRGEPFALLARAAERGPVVIFLATEWECRALVLCNAAGTTKNVQLAITLQQLRDLSGKVSAIGNQRGENRAMAISRPKTSKAKNTSTIESILELLWHSVMKPVIAALELKKSEGRKRAKIHFCTTGAFAFLPLHAAGVKYGERSESCSSYLVASYTPTLSALVSAHKQPTSIKRTDLHALLIAEADVPGYTQLENVADEVSRVNTALRNASVSSVYHHDTFASQEALTAQLSEAHAVHFACHGVQHPTDPLESGFVLRDGLLTVSALTKLKTERALFAFLSACETAQGDKSQPDQVIHLAAALFYIGFKSVVATMWTMGDDDGPIVAEMLYRSLLAEDVFDLDLVPFALDDAVSELRRLGVPAARWATFVHMGV